MMTLCLYWVEIQNLISMFEFIKLLDGSSSFLFMEMIVFIYIIVKNILCTVDGMAV